MFKNAIDLHNNLDVQRFPHLEIPTKHQYLTAITILIRMGRFFDTIINVNSLYDAFTYIPDQHWNRHARKFT